jgi:hypothetical protein
VIGYKLSYHLQLIIGPVSIIWQEQNWQPTGSDLSLQRTESFRICTENLMLLYVRWSSRAFIVHRHYVKSRPQSSTNQKITEQRFRDYALIWITNQHAEIHGCRLFLHFGGAEVCFMLIWRVFLHVELGAESRLSDAFWYFGLIH